MWHSNAVIITWKLFNVLILTVSFNLAPKTAVVYSNPTSTGKFVHNLADFENRIFICTASTV